MAFFEPVIAQFSHSRLKTYEDCPRKAKYLYIDKLTEPKSPHMERGTELHAQLEKYLTNPNEPVPECAMQEAIEGWVEEIKAAGAQAELEMAFDKDWNPVPWFDRRVFMRVKVDALVEMPANDPPMVEIIDWKTGKPYPDHNEQGELYALAAYKWSPWAEQVKVTFAYLDQGTVPSMTYIREALPILEANVMKRVEMPMKDTVFVANPGPKCRWCYFRKSNGGPCEHG